jgi:fermentation-respiration switch protein FrsA (DUF1100 family)
MWARYPKIGNVDTLKYWKNVVCPVLLVYGERDQLVPVDESLSRIEGALVNGTTANAAFIVLNAQHNLTIQPRGNERFFWWHTAPGVYTLVVDWVQTVTSSG